MSKDTMLLYGKNSVSERLKVAAQSVKKIFIDTDFTQPHIEKLARAHKIPLQRLAPKELSKLKPAKDTQGIVAEVERFVYASFDELIIQPEKKDLTPVFLDRIADPHNLGAIIRSLACFGGFAVVIPRFEACEVTEAVLHVASGGENYLPVCLVTNISTAIIAAKKSGYWIAGAVTSDEAQELGRISFPFPLAVVFGSEGEGIRPGIQKHLDIRVRIPMQGAQLSFNVASACAIIGFEILRQKG